MGIKWEVRDDGSAFLATSLEVPALTADQVTINGTPSADTDAVTKAYVDSLVRGLDWQKSVINFHDPAGGLPITPSIGDRYISSGVGSGWSEDFIYEYNGVDWTETPPNTGYAVFVESSSTQYVYNGSAWVLLSSVYDHNTLSGLQGGQASEFYHFKAAEHTWLVDHTTDNGSQHSYINQSVTSLASPTFAGLNLTGFGGVLLATGGSISAVNSLTLTALTLTGFSGVLTASAGVLSAGSDITVDSVTINDTPVNASDAVRKDYVDGLISGLDWQESVKSRFDPTSGTPVLPSLHDRYISLATANGWTVDHIYDWSGAAWTDIDPTEGAATWVETEDKAVVYNGVAWVVFSGGSGGSGYIHVQSSDSSTWTVDHNLGSKYVNITCYDSDDQVIIPDSITAVSGNQATISWATSRTGRAVVSTALTAAVSTYTFSKAVADTTWNINHNLGSKYVSISIFDASDSLVIPDSVVLSDEDNLVVTFNEAVSGTARVFASGAADSGGSSDYVTIEGSQTVNGAKTFASLVATTADINGGTIDGATIGGTTPASGTFSDGAMYGQPLIFSKTIMMPEYIQVESDAIPMLPVEADWAPNGILITKFGIKTSAPSSYSATLEDWTSPTSGSSSDISTASTSASTEADGGVISATVPVGDILFLDLPTTAGLKWIHVWFVYEIKS